MKNNNLPLVVIHCMVYNHENYVRDALDGFVKQITKFPFVAIVHDDASTDASAVIIKEYETKYPDIIKPIYEKENQYQKNDGTIDRIMIEACLATNAKYVAMCEGDDYWTDPYKLQKQVDFLESHPDYGLVHTNFDIADSKHGFKIDKNHRRSLPDGYVYKYILKENFIGTLTVLFRSEFIEIFNREILPIRLWDRIMWICISRYAKVHFIEDTTSVYRILKESTTHGDIKRLLPMDISGTNDLLAFLKNINISEEEIYEFYVPRSRRLLKYSYFAGDRQNLKKYWKVIKKHGQPYKLDIVHYYMGLWFIPKAIYELLLQVNAFRVRLIGKVK